MVATIQPMRLSVQSWAAFQHYKNRKPPWLKLHREVVLDNPAWHRLPNDSKALAPSLWLLASEFEGGVIVYTIDDLAFRLRMTGDAIEAALTPLVASGFFAIEQGASAALAPCEHTALPEEETDIEEETDRAFALFCEAAQRQGWTKPRALETRRKTKLSIRLREGGIEAWQQMLAQAELSDFVRAGTFFTFDWVLNPTNFTKVIEGNYANKSGAGPARPQSFAERAAEAASTVASHDGDDQWRARLKNPQFWPVSIYGPPIGQPGCRVPPHLLAEAGTP